MIHTLLIRNQELSLFLGSFERSKSFTYQIEIQHALPFKINVEEIEKLYDASIPDVYKECFFNPILELNNKGKDKDSLNTNPFMVSLKKLCNKDIGLYCLRRIVFMWVIVFIMEVLNTVLLVVLLSMSYYETDAQIAVITSICLVEILLLLLGYFWMLSLKHMHYKKWRKKSMYMFIGILILQIYQYFALNNTNYAYYFWGMCIFEIVGMIFYDFKNQNIFRKHQQIKVLIRGKF